MKTQDNILYLADKGKIIVRNSDGVNMGSGICLGESDSIENYHEEDGPDYVPEKEGDVTNNEENKEENSNE